MTNSWVASSTWHAVSMPEQQPHSVTVRIAAPHEYDGSWWCRYEISGLSTVDAIDSRELAGEDSLQALLLTISFVERVLADFIRHGGQLVDDDGAAMPLSAYFPAR